MIISKFHDQEMRFTCCEPGELVGVELRERNVPHHGHPVNLCLLGGLQVHVIEQNRTEEGYIAQLRRRRQRMMLQWESLTKYTCPSNS